MSYYDGSTVLGDPSRWFQYHCYDEPYVPTLDRNVLVRNTEVRPLVDPEIARWMRAYVAFAEAQVLSEETTGHNAIANITEIRDAFGDEGFINHCKTLGLTPLEAPDPIHGPCFPPPFHMYPCDTVDHRVDGEVCDRCGSRWYCWGWSGSCCAECGAYT